MVLILNKYEACLTESSIRVSKVETIVFRFLSRVRMRQNAERDIVIYQFCPSLRAFNACIVSK